MSVSRPTTASSCVVRVCEARSMVLLKASGLLTCIALPGCAAGSVAGGIKHNSSTEPSLRLALRSWPGANGTGAVTRGVVVGTLATERGESGDRFPGSTVACDRARATSTSVWGMD
eukprot:365679-Chlamydomonas_euryale.AAC.35